jgi:hypothetical protein
MESIQSKTEHKIMGGGKKKCQMKQVYTLYSMEYGIN